MDAGALYASYNYACAGASSSGGPPGRAAAGSPLGSGSETDAVAAVGALVLATVVSVLTLPVLGNRAWHAVPPEGEERPGMIGGRGAARRAKS